MTGCLQTTKARPALTSAIGSACGNCNSCGDGGGPLSGMPNYNACAGETACATNGMAFACSGGACFSLPTPACGRILSRLSTRGHDRPEAIVGVAEIGGNAAAGGTTRVLDVVPPCSASRRAAGSALAALRVYRGRPAVIRRVVPIGAPFVNVLAHLEEAVPVGLAMAGGFGAVPPTAGIDGGQFVAPGVEALLEAAAGGEFPLGLGGQEHPPIPLAGEPLAVRRGIEPSHDHHGKRGGG